MECSSQVFSTILRLHWRRVIDRCKAPRRTTNLRKLEQLESGKSTDVTPIKNRQLSAKEHADKIERIQKKSVKTEWKDDGIREITK